MKRKRWPLVLGAVVILSGFGYLVFGGIGDNLVYFLTPSELLARGPEAYDKPVRLGGQVVPGSVEWDARALDLRFQMSDGSQAIAVHSKGAPPQMFRDGMGVVVEGRLVGNVFQSHNLMVKHSNEYRAPEDGTHPREAYKTLIQAES